MSSPLLSWVQTAVGDMDWRGSKREENGSERATSTVVNKGIGKAAANFMLIHNG